MTTFYLVRQAEAASTLDLPEELWPLSEKGQAQANQLIPILGNLRIQYVYSAEDRRSLDTVLPFSQAYGLNILVLSELREHNIKAHDVSLQRQAWANFDFSLPSSESNRVAQRRIVLSIHSLMLHHLNDEVAVVMPTCLIALFLNAIDPQFTFDQWQEQGIPDMIRLVRGEYNISWTRIDHARPLLALVRNQEHPSL